jgi:hypothetical protein
MIARLYDNKIRKYLKILKIALVYTDTFCGIFSRLPLLSFGCYEDVEIV